jgi:hypothetical protein
MAQGFRVRAIPGVIFNSYEEAQKAIAAKKAEQQGVMADRNIARYNVAESQIPQSQKMASDAGPDAWMTAPKEDLQRISEGQVINEMYGSKPIGNLRMARLMGLSGSQDPKAKEFVSGLENEVQEERLAAGIGSSTAELRKRELDEQINAMPDGKQKEWMKENYYMLLTAPGGVFKGSPSGLSGRTSEQEALLPGKIKEKAAESSIEVDAAKKKKAADLELERDNAAIVEDKKQVKDQVGKKLVIDIVDEIKNDPAFATGLDIGRIGQAIPGTKGYTFAQKVNNLKNRLSLEERSKMKGQGQISDFEGKMLAQSVSILSTNLRKEDFEKELDRIRDVLNGKYSGLTDEEEEPDEFDSLWNAK